MGTPAIPATDTPLSSLAAGAAHDLRNVLFVISAHCERLLTTVADGDPRSEDLHAIADAAAHGAALAREVVTGAQEQERSSGPIDINDVIRGIEPLIRRLVGEHITVGTSFSEGAWAVTANAVQIEQVVMNLAVNGRDAMPGGGSLLITTENRSVTATGQASEFVVIAVTDTGVGIDPAVQARIFEPYFTTKGPSGGTGVGLATVRAIALLNGGYVELSTSVGTGTTVRLVLPRGALTPDRPADRRNLHPVAAPTVQSQGKRILLVENERAIRDYLHRCLSAQGYDVQVASSGAEALEMCESPRLRVDAVVTDVHLPDITGPTVASRLRAQWPDVGVVFMSGGVEILDDLSESGTVPVLAKPFTASELVTAVRTALEPRRAA
jgi:two-component system, cell cycle sensor histidine kinase and response regulator CckA